MNKVEQAINRLFGSLSKLSNQEQFAVVGGFLIIFYVFRKMKQYNRRNNSQYRQLREMAALLQNKDRQKRDGILWFFNLFIFLFFFTLLSYLLMYVSIEYSFKPVVKFLNVLNVSRSGLSLYLRVALVIELLACLILYKFVHHYNSKIPKEAAMSDSKAQEQRDKLQKEQKNMETKTKEESDIKQSAKTSKKDD